MLFEARFFTRDKDGNKIFVGSTQLDDSCTSYAFPLVAKAMRHAPEKARGASRVEFRQINYRDERGPQEATGYRSR